MSRFVGHNKFFLYSLAFLFLFLVGCAPTGSPESPVTLSPFDFILQTVFFFLTALFIWYLFVLKPEIDRENKANKFIEGLKKGDQVETSSGILGTIVSVANSVATVEIAPNVKIKVRTSHLSAAASPTENKSADNKKR